MPMFYNRQQAGIELAKTLKSFRNNKESLIFALPRGGVPIAHEISQALNIPYDVFLVRKLGTPGFEELAMGAIALGHVTVFNQDVINSMHISNQAIEEVIEKEEKELQRRNQRYRQGREIPNLSHKTIILVDDGIATGATIKAAIKALQQLKAHKIIVAVPVAPMETVEELKQTIHAIYCLSTPYPFTAIGSYYANFPQLSDHEVISLMQEATNSNR